MEVQISESGNKLPQFVAAFAACLGAFAQGTALSWTSPALPHISDCTKDCDFNFDATTGSWIGSIFTLGALSSSFVAAYLMGAIGRKKTLIIMAAPFIVGWLLLLLPVPLKMNENVSKWMFLVGRYLTGFAGGSFPLVATVYVTEVAEAGIRGSLGIVMNVMMTSGILFVNGVGSIIDWVVLTGILICFPLLTAFLMIFMPESPVYLFSKGRESDAKKSLQWLRGEAYDISPEIDQIKENLRHQDQLGSVTLWQMFSERVYRKPTVIMMTMFIFRQLNGNMAVGFYLTDIFNKAGTGLDPGLQATIVSIVQVFANLVAASVVDRFGRRIMLLTSCFLTSVSIASLGVYFFLDERDCSDQPCTSGIVATLNWLPLTSLIVFLFGNNIGLGPLPWLMNGEMYSEEAKGTSASIAAATHWTSTFIITRFAADIQKAINPSGSYFLYASLTLVGAVFVALVVPETKGKSPEEMRAYFERRPKTELKGIENPLVFPPQME